MVQEKNQVRLFITLIQYLKYNLNIRIKLIVFDFFQEKVDGFESEFMIQIAAGHSFSLALSKQGKLFCWGAVNGQIDDEYFYEKPM